MKSGLLSSQVTGSGCSPHRLWKQLSLGRIMKLDCAVQSQERLIYPIRCVSLFQLVALRAEERRQWKGHEKEDIVS